MKHDPTLRTPVAVPVWQEPEQARQELEDRMQAFLQAALEAPSGGEEALVLRVSPGLGKTRTAQRLLARHGEQILARGHVFVYVPTLDLAERAAAELRAIAPHLPITVARGRQARRPEGEAPMCERLDLVKRIEGLVWSVTASLCRVSSEGEVHEAPCAARCPYLAQMDVPGAQIVFLAHSYLHATPPVHNAEEVALRIVDEKVWPSLLRPSRLSVADFLCAPVAAFADELREDYVRARAVIVDALQMQAPLHDRLTAAGFSPEQLLAFAKAEEATQERPRLHPSMTPEVLGRTMDFFDAGRLARSRKRAQILKLAAARTSGHCNRLLFERESSANGAAGEVIRIFDMIDIPRDCPLILLDADADPEITAHTVPGAQFVRLDVPPRAHVVQIADRTLAQSWLEDAEKAPERIAAAFDVVEREVARSDGRGVLLIATRKVLAALHAFEGRPAGDDAQLRQRIRGAEPRWFGPRMQGVNDYGDVGTVVVIGRLQPGPADVEQATRSIFGDDDTPLITLNGGGYTRRATSRLLRDGGFVDGIVQTHPDARVERVLMQMREAATLQAIARLRLLAPSQSKRVVIVSNLPLPDFPVDTLTTWDALRQGLEDEPDPSGYQVMQTALRATMGRQVRGTRLSAAGLVTDLPLDFPTLGAAERFRRGRTPAAMNGLVHRIAAANGWPVSDVELSVPGKGGKPVPAVVFVERAGTHATATQLWPGHAVRVLP